MWFQVAWCLSVCYGGRVDGADLNLIVGMFSAMAALIVASIWNQHREAARTRAECTRQIERATAENTRQIERASGENTHQIERAFGECTRQIERASKENTRQIEQASKENTRQIERASERLSGEFNELRDEFSEHRRVTRKRHEKLWKALDRNNDTTQRKLDKITDSLADARERLARIEGRLETGGPTVTDPELHSDSSEAA